MGGSCIKRTRARGCEPAAKAGEPRVPGEGGLLAAGRAGKLFFLNFNRIKYLIEARRGLRGHRSLARYGRRMNAWHVFICANVIGNVAAAR